MDSFNLTGYELRHNVYSENSSLPINIRIEASVQSNQYKRVVYLVENLWVH